MAAANHRAAAVNHGTHVAEVGIHLFGPLGRRIVLTKLIVDIAVVVEIARKRVGYVHSQGAGRIGAVVHLDCIAAGLHQICHGGSLRIVVLAFFIAVEHVGPVERLGGEIHRQAFLDC